MTANTELQYTNEYALAFSGNPMIVSLTMDSSEFPTGATATQVILSVTINSRSYQFSSEIANSETISFDISSAWRAEYLRQVVAPTDTEYEVPEGTVSAHVGYINEDDLTLSYGSEVTLYQHIFALRGGVTEADIELNGWTTPDSAVITYKGALTRKPSGTLIYNVGDSHRTSKLMLTNISNVLAGTSTLKVKTTTTAIAADSSITGISVVNDSNRHEILYQNSFGVIESVSCYMLEEQKHTITTTSSNIAGSQTYANSNRARNTATDRHSSWDMSSGYLSTEWVYWFADEFLSAAHHWLRLSSGTFVPVKITTSNEDNVIYDRTKAELTDITFKVTSILQGRITI